VTDQVIYLLKQEINLGLIGKRMSVCALQEWYIWIWICIQISYSDLIHA
jgi:hypothetical protein